MSAGQDDLVERLRAQRDTGQRTMGGASASTDGSFTSWGGEKIMAPVNPDGGAAIAEITRLRADKAALVEALEAVLTSCSGPKVGGGGGGTYVVYPPSGKAWNNARAAIARAGGEA